MKIRKFEIVVVLALILHLVIFFNQGVFNSTTLIYIRLGIQIMLPLLVLAYFKKDLKSIGLNFKKKREIGKYSLVLVCIVSAGAVYASTMPDVQLYYPINPSAKDNIPSFLMYELVDMTLVVFATEFFWRGFVVLGLKRFGMVAIVISAIPYGIVHLGKPAIELYSSFIAGIVLGYVAYKCESIAPTFIGHRVLSLIVDVLA